MSWDEMPAKVWVPAWRSRAHERKKWLTGLTPASITELAKDPSSLAVRLRYAVTPHDERSASGAGRGSVLGPRSPWPSTRRMAAERVARRPVVLESKGVSINRSPSGGLVVRRSQRRRVAWHL